MQFIGSQLKSILEKQQREVAVYDSRSYPRGAVKPATALRMVESGSYVGIGNPKRIRAIRPLNGNMTIGQLYQASHTTVRPRNDHRVLSYKEVWFGLMSKLAPKYGVSDVALAKACRKRKIPLPGRGYWAKVATGQAPGRRPALPALARRGSK